jgi:hypothetical protein
VSYVHDDFLISNYALELKLVVLFKFTRFLFLGRLIFGRMFDLRNDKAWRPRFLVKQRMLLFITFLSFVQCTPSPSDLSTKAAFLHSDLHRAMLLSKRLGRFGIYGLLEENMEKIPCQTPLSDANRKCEVFLVGKGKVTLEVIPVTKSETLKKNALISVLYSTDCSNKSFDFKTFDLVMQRGSAEKGVTVWQNNLIRVIHQQVKNKDGEHCSVRVQVASDLLTRAQNFVLPAE